MLLDVCSRVLLWYQAKDKSPNPMAEQMNWTLPNTLVVVVLGVVVTVGGDTEWKEIRASIHTQSFPYLKH